jgi:drug/metabolite transporter (DMT)-like permease
MINQTFKSNLVLLITAAIWGLAFVAQRIGAQYIGSFTFNGIRFALGSLTLIPLLVFSKNPATPPSHQRSGLVLSTGIIAGTVLFIASSLQQIGLADTSAGKAAFITGLYIVIVPLLGFFLKQRVPLFNWIGVVFAVTGLYFLSVTEDFSIGKGDLLELAGSFFWAIHILLIDNFSKRVDIIKLSLIQFLTCSFLSLTAAFIIETISLSGIRQAAVPILYGGIFSVGAAYTLQAIGQKHAKPSHAAIILSMESVFASIGGLIILGEDLGLRGYLGCFLMLVGMFISQSKNIKKPPIAKTQVDTSQEAVGLK